jgi:hypothetical protein
MAQHIGFVTKLPKGKFVSSCLANSMIKTKVWKHQIPLTIKAIRTTILISKQAIFAKIVQTAR